MSPNIIQIQSINEDDLRRIIKEVVSEQISKLHPSHSGSKKREVYLTRKELSLRLKVSVQTLIDWDRKGILKPYRIGNQIRYKESELESCLESINSIGDD